MANEITISTSLNFTKDGATSSAKKTFKADMAGSRYDQGVQDIGTSAEQLALKSDFGTPGLVYFRNLDATNYIEIGHWNAGTPTYFLKLLAGEACTLRLDVSKTNIGCLANTATCQLEYLVIEE